MAHPNPGNIAMATCRNRTGRNNQGSALTLAQIAERYAHGLHCRHGIRRAMNKP
jgi:hypothetical protein